MKIIQAELRRLHSPDAVDLPLFTPLDAEYFGLLVQAMVGPKGQQGCESFDFMVCSPRWLENKMSSTGYVLGRHYLLLPKYDYNLIWQVIQGLCDEAEAPDWKTVASRLSRYGRWEFADRVRFV